MAYLKSVGDYLFNVIIVIDLLANALIRGCPYETLSSVAYRKHRDKTAFKWTMGFVDKLFFWQDKHCETAYINDRQRVLPK